MHSGILRTTRPRVPSRFVLVAALALGTVGVGLLLATGEERREPKQPPAESAPSGAEDSSDDRLTDTLDPDLATHAVELVTVGFDMLSQSPIVLLREPRDGKVVPIWVGIAEAQAISRALYGVVPPRPMTHDLMASLLRELDAELVEVVVNDMREHTYFGKLKLRVGRDRALRIVDTRPSDGLALALRTGATIHIADKILDATPEFGFVPPDEEQQVVRALGLTVVKPTPERLEEFDLPRRAGVLVLAVRDEAVDAGLRRGDLIIEVNGQVPAAPIAFFEAVRATRPGGEVRIRYLRDGNEHTATLRVREQPRRPERPDPLRPGRVRL